MGLERLRLASVLASSAAWVGVAAGAGGAVSIPAVARGIAITLQAHKSAIGKTLPKFKATAESREDWVSKACDPNRLRSHHRVSRTIRA